MNFTEGLQNALDYIETHLTQPMEYADIAEQAACSSFYFQRIFTFLCGFTLGEYIRYRRLTMAGAELALGNHKVIDIALKYGYDSPDSFSKAFGRFHGVTPSEAKKPGVSLHSIARLSVKLSLKGGNIMNFKVVEKDAFHVIEKVELHNTDNSENAKSIPDFWTRAHQDGTVKKLFETAKNKTFIFGICYGDSDEHAKTFHYSIAAECSNDSPVPNGFRKNTIPARTWVVFACHGPMPDAIQNTWHEIVTEFFPTSGYTPTCEFDIEAYTDGDMSSPDYRSEIWVPVQKK